MGAMVDKAWLLVLVVELVGIVALSRARKFTGRDWLRWGLIGHFVVGLFWQAFAFKVIGPKKAVDLFDYLRVIGLASYAAMLIGLLMLVSTGVRRGMAMPGGHSRSSSTPTELSEGLSVIAERREENSLARAERVRDMLHDRVVAVARKMRVNVVGYKSPNFSHNVWLEFDVTFNTAASDVKRRAAIKITIERKDYHKYENELTLEVNDGHTPVSFDRLLNIDEQNIATVFEFLAGKRRRLKLRALRARRFVLEFWRPNNKVVRVKPALIQQLGLVAILPVFLGVVLTSGAVIYLGVVIALAWAICYWVWLYQHRHVYTLSKGRPLQDPRFLARLDSWQVNLMGLGQLAVEFRQELLRELSQSRTPEMQISPEMIWYRGVDGKEEREQLVVSFRRAMGFVHLGSYGTDLYVGWDSHVNMGSWKESVVATGYDRSSSTRVRATTIEPDWHWPNEYDLHDNGFLTEWLHAAVSKLCKRKLAEYRIDQEIDFRITRESRRDVMSAGDESRPGDDNRGARRGGLRERIRRLA